MDQQCKPLDEGPNSMGTEKTPPLYVMLDLEHIEKATVLKDISDINFTALTYLRLDDNQIESIEGLPRVQIPHI
jgi:hypothetical protein